jgi:DNA-binding Xre family transcriptional regulator
MSDTVEKGSLGQSFSDFLVEQGTYEETTSASIKRVRAWQLQQVMSEQKISKVEMSKRLDTSRAQLDRLLDPSNDSVTLATLSRAAEAVGRKLTLELA